MKTAMQELIEWTNQYKGQMISADQVVLKANKLLKKEKEQIIEASNNGALKSMVHREKLDKMSEDELRDSLVEDTISYGEEYYNQTFNKNK
jgi:hypothetical protein